MNAAEWFRELMEAAADCAYSVRIEREDAVELATLLESLQAERDAARALLAEAAPRLSHDAQCLTVDRFEHCTCGQQDLLRRIEKGTK